MKNKLIALSIVSALSSSLANSVALDPIGSSGQELTYPYFYYNVNDNKSVLLKISNTTDQGKALEVRFFESLNKREVLGFKVYLSANDVWDAVVFGLEEAGPANLITGDHSCTVPAIKTSTTLPVFPDGTPYVPFRNFGYTGVNDDAGPDDLSRTREGYIEIREVGSVVKGSPVEQALVPQSNGDPTDCAYLVSGWAPGGFWTQNPKAYLDNPSGGLDGTATIIYVPKAPANP